MLASRFRGDAQPTAPPPPPAYNNPRTNIGANLGNINYEQPAAYQPERFHLSGEAQSGLGKLSEVGAGLMDPDSEYYKRLVGGMREQIGKGTAADQRSQALRQAYAGGGHTGEAQMNVADIGQAGLEAEGQAAADMRLKAPGMGAGILSDATGKRMGAEQYGHGAYQAGSQYGHGAEQQAGQFGAGLGLEQQRMGLQAEIANQQAAQQAHQNNMNSWMTMMNAVYS
jgi:hypothetical protein